MKRIISLFALLFVLNSIMAQTSVTITVSPNDTICYGTTTTFSASGVGGASYQWFVGTRAVTANSTAMTTYTVRSINNKSAVKCVMTAEITTYNSNVITMAVLPVYEAKVRVLASASSICEGGEVTFTAIPFNGGTEPVYSWAVNGASTDAATNEITVDTITKKRYRAEAYMISSYVCTTSSTDTTRGAVEGKVITNLEASATVSVNGKELELGEGAASDTIATSTATAVFRVHGTNLGTRPQFVWHTVDFDAESDVTVGSRSNFYTKNRYKHDTMVYVQIQSNYQCPLGDTLFEPEYYFYIDTETLSEDGKILITRGGE